MYTVIKTIKGRRYLYEQRTWRDGRRVRTESRYLGPLEIVSQAPRKMSLARRVGEFLEAQGPLFSAADKYAELAEQQALAEDRDEAQVADDAASTNSSPAEAASGEGSTEADAGPSGGGTT